ncbi:hypothetical protein ACFQ44_05470 [Levilactobacillus lanxiensis]|uniref:Peptidase M10 metallopeptidase domain-containing protein n=1 Tax=Levilactobacillus lanxiensis TaxID=2799568 RepID=A0ABW4D322_9LACO|nr:hypothetical protein [Levilactobacillus lanxiensis]
MKRKTITTVGIITATLSVGLVTLNASENTGAALAKTKAVKIVKTKKLSGKAYRAKKGYLYKNKQLTKKSWSLKHHRKTTFYAKKQVTVKKPNGKKAIYFYVVTKNHRTKGYVWRGNLKRYVVKKSKKATTTKKVVAKPTVTKTELQSLINQSPDLDPTGKLLSLSKKDYQTYDDLFDTNFNLTNFSDTGVFKHHQAKLYVKDSAMNASVAVAIKKWNDALGKTVFTLGTQGNHTMTVKLGNNQENDQEDNWIGLYDRKTVLIDQTDFNDVDVGNSSTADPDLKQQYESLGDQVKQNKDKYDAQKASISASYQSQFSEINQKVSQATAAERTALTAQRKQLAVQKRAALRTLQDAYSQKDTVLRSQRSKVLKQLISKQHTNFIGAVIMHELGHSLGLDHTPYLADMLFANGNLQGKYTSANVKYPWEEFKGPEVKQGIDTGILSQRDIDRAKLTEQLGYW